MASLTVETWQCDACGKESDIKLQCCGGCKSVYYCDAKCQQQHWNAGHKNECKVMKLEKSKEKFETCTEKGQLQSDEYKLKDVLLSFPSYFLFSLSHTINYLVNLLC